MAEMPIWPLIRSSKFVSVGEGQDIIPNEASLEDFV